MAVAVGFSSFISGKCLKTKRTSNPYPSICNNPGRKSDLFERAEIKMVPQSQTYMKKATKRKTYDPFVVRSSSSTHDTSSLSPAQTIMQFYSSINEKNMSQLNKLVAEDCYFEDYSFPKPFQGKKEVMHFLEQLTMCIGDYKNMQFNVDLICEGNENTVAVNWHLDWKKLQVPFTRGCSHFSLSVNDDKLLIKKAQVLIESPIKLGVVALAIFKTTSSLFDAFPAATEWFLKSPHTMFRLLQKAYNIVVQPVITPFLAWYINILNFAACILSTTLKILYYLAKFFHM